MRRCSTWPDSTASGSAITGPWAGYSALRSQRDQPLERREIVFEIAAAAPGDDDAAALDHQVANERGARRRVPQRDVIGRVTGRVQHGQRFSAGHNRLAIDQRLPFDLVADVLLRPGKFGERGGRMPPGDQRRPGGVIGVAVRHQHARQVRLPDLQLTIDLFQMPRIADTRIDQRGTARPAGQEVGVVASTRHRAGVVSVEENRSEDRLRHHRVNNRRGYATGRERLSVALLGASEHRPAVCTRNYTEAPATRASCGGTAPENRPARRRSARRRR